MENNKDQYSLEFAIGDEKILRFCGRSKKVTEYRDFLMDKGIMTDLVPYPNGVYDERIFGKIKSSSQSKIDDFTESNKWGYIDLGFFYCPYTMRPKMGQILRSLGVEWMSTVDRKGDAMKPSIDNIVLQADYAQFEPNGTDTIRVTDDITDYKKCGWEGLIAALDSLGKTRESELVSSGLNRLLAVTPLAARPIQRMGGEINNHADTNAYRAILWALDVLNNPKDGYMATHNNPTEDDNCRIAAMMFLIRKMVNTFHADAKIFKGGKENFSRNMQNNRIISSGRAVIVPDPLLKIDEVGIPIHLAYQMADEEFVDYLRLYYNGKVDENGEVALEDQLSTSEAWSIYKKCDKNTQKLFFDYIAGVVKTGDGKELKDPLGPKLCILNRQPSLHQLSLMVCHVKLTYDNAIKYAIGLCSPLGADFDGDKH